MQIDLSVLIAICGFALSIATFFIGRTTSAKNAGQQTGQVLTELGYIKKGVDGLEKRFEKLQENYNELKTRVTKLEEKVGFYHHE